MTALIDTNVMLDFLLTRNQFAQDACNCIERIKSAKGKAYITASTITDIYYITRRALKDHDAAKAIISKILNSFQIASVSKADCMRALEVETNDYEDALVFVCAERIKADYIITRNNKHFSASPVKAVTPVQFLESYP